MVFMWSGQVINAAATVECARGFLSRCACGFRSVCGARLQSFTALLNPLVPSNKVLLYGQLCPGLTVRWRCGAPLKHDTQARDFKKKKN